VSSFNRGPNRADHFKSQPFSHFENREDIRLENIPDAYLTEVKQRRLELIEALSNADDYIGDLFLNEKTPSKQEIKVCSSGALRLNS
jgi:hypothetical protein